MQLRKVNSNPELLIAFQKTPSQKSRRDPNTCHKIVVRKLPI